jgi:hypothetical protein
MAVVAVSGRRLCPLERQEEKKRETSIERALVGPVANARQCVVVGGIGFPLENIQM